MKNTLALTTLALCAAAALAPTAGAADKSLSSASPAASAASAVAPSTVRRRLQFQTKHQVPTQFALAAPDHAPVGKGFRFTAKFAGQARAHECSLGLPKAGQVVRPGESAIGTIQCATDWEVYDNGLSYEAFENGVKIGGGTLRP
jgi:hypothetical protein